MRTLSLSLAIASPPLTSATLISPSHLCAAYPPRRYYILKPSSKAHRSIDFVRCLSHSDLVVLMSRSDPPNPNNGWVNPRRPLTAMISSDGAAGGEIISPSHPSIVNPNRLAPHPRYGNIISRHPPTARVSSGGDAGGGKISPIDPSIVNPHPRSGNIRGCHPPTAMTDGSGGSVGGSSTSSLPLAKPMMNSAAQPVGTCYAYRHPPIGCTSTDPYWIRGGLQRLTSFHYIGGGEGEKADSEAEPNDVSPMSTYPFKVSTESWEAAEAEAEEWMIDEGLIRSGLSLSCYTW